MPTRGATTRDDVRTAVQRHEEHHHFDTALELIDLTERLGLEVNLEPAQEAAYEAVLQRTRTPDETFQRLLAALRISPRVGREAP